MHVTEVRIKLMEEPGERLKAFCSITFDDCFVVRDLKIIDGASGPFVAMPSRKLTSHCVKCGMKNHLRANYCNQCGVRQAEGRALRDADGRAKLYADIAHPINAACREKIQNAVVEEYFLEIERAKEPGYISRYEDYDGGDFGEEHHDSRSSDIHPAETKSPTETRRFDSAHSGHGAHRPHDLPKTSSQSGTTPQESRVGPTAGSGDDHQQDVGSSGRSPGAPHNPATGRPDPPSAILAPHRSPPNVGQDSTSDPGDGATLAHSSSREPSDREPSSRENSGRGTSSKDFGAGILD